MHRKDSGIRPIPVREVLHSLVPFGSHVAEEAFLKEELAKQRNFLERLRRFPDLKWLSHLLRVCWDNQKVNHLLRLSWDPETLAFTEELEAEIRHTPEEILFCSLCDNARMQCGLPVKLGWFGVSHPSLVQVVAFLSSSLCEVVV